MIYRLIRAVRASNILPRLMLFLAIAALCVGGGALLAWMFDPSIKAYRKHPAAAVASPKVDAAGKVATCPAGRFLVRFPPGTEPELVCLSGSLPSWEKPSEVLKRGGRQ